MTHDALIDFVVSQAMIETGAPASVVQARAGRLVTRLAIDRAERSYNPAWTQEEDEFLRANLGRLSEGQMAQRLGRSVTGVHLRWKRDLRLPAPSKDPRYITGCQIAKALGIDSHIVARWLIAGLLPAEIIASDYGRVIRRVHRVAFLRWVVNPANWVWLKLERIRDPHLRRLVELKLERWGDEWWTTSQVAAFHGVEVGDVKRYIAKGKIKAYQAPNRSGRHADPAWVNHFVLHSEATRPDLRFYKGRGTGREYSWSREADRFIVLARAVGVSVQEIGRLMAWDHKRVAYRLAYWLGDSSALVDIIFSEGASLNYRLPVGGRRDADGKLHLWADWRELQGRFPFLSRAVRRFLAYLDGAYRFPVLGPGNSNSDLLAVRGVMTAWAWFYADTPEQEAFAGRLAGAGHASAKTLGEYYRTLQSWGVDPFDLSS